MNSVRRVVWGVISLMGIVVLGVIGYTIIEGWSFLDSLYMTVIAITTVGFNEVHPLSTGGRVFSIFLIVGGVGGALYTLTGIIQYFVEGNVLAVWEKRRMNKKISELKNHFILCGFGRVGEEIATIFSEENVPIVIIDNRDSCIERAKESGYLFIEGDATSDEVLKEAGIEHARGLIASLGTDVDNTYVTLSARGLFPTLFITARASDREAEKKLRRAGANRIVSPTSIGARRMAMLSLRPAVTEFIDTVTRRRGPELQLENVVVSDKSSFAGLTIDDVRKSSRANILALHKKTGRIIANPSSEEKIDIADSLIIMGTSEQLGALEAICEGVQKND